MSTWFKHRRAACWCRRCCRSCSRWTWPASICWWTRSGSGRSALFRIDVLTIFPEMFSALEASMVGRARQAGLLDVRVSDIRAYSAAKHKNTDDYPFGGGAGMLMTAQPIADAIKALAPAPYKGLRVLMSPRGQLLTQQLVQKLSQAESLLIVCGRYEGVDERVSQRYIDLELSIGDYVLTGGELPAMVLIDAVARLREGVLGQGQSALEESFTDDHLLEYPQYTRPRVFEGLEVPEVLLGGNHAQIDLWRRRQRLLVTAQRRPDLLPQARLTDEERAWLREQGF
ncbi:MAG: tRNA (guanosine(37)-N1)-methyltransferase TrmD [Clostridiales bacterium]|nr:tRNA (guanosine(37)-N1)-methyltransferase TrmD [Clostridiales bacterium]